MVTKGMNEKYEEWAKKWLGENGWGDKDGYGQCEDAAKAMAQEFPELTSVPGHVWAGPWGQRQHWWLTTADGTIVDPTATQFPVHVDDLIYEAFQPGHSVVVGRCRECGDDIEKKLNSLDEPIEIRDFCSSRCENAYTASLMAPVQWEGS